MKETFVEQTKSLLEKDWSPEEYTLLKRMIDNLICYKNFIPNLIKNDITDLLHIANKIKTDYDTLKKSFDLKIYQLDIVTGRVIKEALDKESQTDKEVKTYTIISRFSLDPLSNCESHVFLNYPTPHVSVSTSVSTSVPKKKKRNFFQKVFFID
jgi:hypothetical protein